MFLLFRKMKLLKLFDGKQEIRTENQQIPINYLCTIVLITIFLRSSELMDEVQTMKKLIRT